MLKEIRVWYAMNLAVLGPESYYACPLDGNIPSVNLAALRCTVSNLVFSASILGLIPQRQMYNTSKVSGAEFSRTLPGVLHSNFCLKDHLPIYYSLCSLDRKWSTFHVQLLLDSVMAF